MFSEADAAISNILSLGYYILQHFISRLLEVMLKAETSLKENTTLVLEPCFQQNYQSLFFKEKLSLKLLIQSINPKLTQ